MNGKERSMKVWTHCLKLSSCLIEILKFNYWGKVIDIDCFSFIDFFYWKYYNKQAFPSLYANTYVNIGM